MLAQPRAQFKRVVRPRLRYNLTRLRTLGQLRLQGRM